MFAVIKTGGKQYKVAKGQLLVLEKLAAYPGKKVQFNEVLLIGGEKTVVGNPKVKDAGVQAEVVDQIRGKKTISFVKRRRKSSSQRKKGHRQSLTVVKITDILASGAEKSGVEQANGAGGSTEDFGNFSKSGNGVAGSKAKSKDIDKVTVKGTPKKTVSSLKENEKKETPKAKVVSKKTDTKKATKDKTSLKSERKKPKASSK